MARAKYIIERQDEVVVVITDVGEGITVTNDAEAVVKELYDHGILRKQKLYYYDSEGQLDELKHNWEGKFTGFAPGPDRKPR